MIAVCVYLILGLNSVFCQNIELKTQDGCIISADLNVKNPKNPFVLEVHGLGSDKREWSELNIYLSSKEINYISIDLRGHGKSLKCKDGYIKYPEITKKDIERFKMDVAEAEKFIISKYPDAVIIPAGASIGANLVMTLFYKKAKKIILLSPGLNYAGYDIADFFKKTSSNIMFAVSENDYYSLSSVRVFMEILSKRKTKYNLILADKGHGVEIFKKDQSNEYIKKIIEFIKN